LKPVIKIFRESEEAPTITSQFTAEWLNNPQIFPSTRPSNTYPRNSKRIFCVWSSKIND